MPVPPASDLKARLRRQALARRDGLDPAWREEASRAVAAQVVDLPDLRRPGPVAGFWPIRSEIDVRPVLQALHDQGRTLCLPVVTANGLVFRAWSPGDPMAVTGFGLTVPLPSAPAIDPAVLLVPLSAFDRSGGRIGYGKGHYDRALAGLDDPVTIGVAFSVQEVEEVPMEPHDRPLGVIVTEAGVIRAPAASTSSP